MMTLTVQLLAATAAISSDSRTFWKPEGGPLVQPLQVSITAELLREGEHIVVYREQGHRFSTLGEADEQAQISAAVDTFDRVIYPVETKAFGPPPDLDSNGKVILLLARFSSDTAMVFRFDQLPEAQARRYGFHSNQAEVLYHSFSQQGNREARNLAALAFSFHRLLHLARDPNETGWSELLANYSERLCSLAPERLLWGEDDPIRRSAAPSDPWAATGWPLLFLHYLSEREGSDVIGALVARPEAGLTGLSAALRERSSGASAADLLADFAMACWLDDPHLAGGRFAFATTSPPRPQPAVHVGASRPALGQVSCGVGGMVHLLVEGDGDRPLPLTLQGDPSGRWIGRAVHLRLRGPEEELPLQFDATQRARLEIPLLTAGEGVVVAVVAQPDGGAGFDRRSLPLLWGLGWVPRVPADPERAALATLAQGKLSGKGVAARDRLLATLDRLSGRAPAEGVGTRLSTRYAWAPEAGAVVEALVGEARLRGLVATPLTFLRRAPTGIEQEWQDLLIEARGSDPRQRPIILAAHWDGARSSLDDSYLRALNVDDNASGVAVALETAALVAHQPHRAPIVVALLAGGYHGAAGAAVALEQLQGKLAAWIELDGVGAASPAPRHVAVRLEADDDRAPVVLSLAESLERFGLSPQLIKGSPSTHTGAGLCTARGIPAVVVRTREADVTANDLDLPVEAERERASPELMLLLANALAAELVQLAGAR